MSSGIGSATSLTPAEIARRQQLRTPASTQQATEPSQASQTAAVQAQQGAQAAQPEAFNAPRLSLPASPTTRDVLMGLQRAMARDDVNASSVAKLSQLHDMIMQADRAMVQAIMDGVRS